mmetsp:Transcript_62581/g.134449  ORF Transcript_62581/g.134449 Transcript_62581/m.134449 type:complete len:185 (+) Transcript_62581:67-621(+)
MDPAPKVTISDAFSSSNWNSMTPTGFRMGRQTDAFVLLKHDQNAMYDWVTRVRKENDRLGIRKQASLPTFVDGRQVVSEVRFPTLNGWGSVSTLPAVTHSEDFVPASRGPLSRPRPRIGSTNHEYGSFHVKRDAASSEAMAPLSQLQAPFMTMSGRGASASGSRGAPSVQSRIEKLEASLLRKG